MAPIRLPILLVALMISASPISSVAKTCPENTLHISDYTCIHVRRPRHHVDCERLSKNYTAAAELCKDLTIGDLKWNLPKIDSKKKVIETARILGEVMATETRPHTHHDDHHHHEVHNDSQRPWIWLGLRRRRPKPKRTGRAAIDESDWYWTTDNTTMTLWKAQRENFWMQSEPKPNDGNDFCAIAEFFENEPNEGDKLKFVSIFCKKPAKTHKGTVTEQSADMMAYACTAEIPMEKESTPVTEQWWFYLICAILVLVPIVVIVVVLIIFCRKRPKSDRRRRSTSKEKRKKKRSKDNEDLSIGEGSVTGEQYTSSSGSKSVKAYPYNRAKVGRYVPPPAFYSSAISGTETTATDSNRIYHNVHVEPKTKKSKGKKGRPKK